MPFIKHCIRRCFFGNISWVFFLVSVMITGLAAEPCFAKTLTISTISVSPVDEIENFQPFADYLKGRLASDGIDDVKILIASDIPALARMLTEGKVDIFIDSSVTAMVVNEMSGSSFLVRRWKKNRPQYRSAIVVVDDSSIHQINDLEGKRIAFEEPFSTSGFMLPALTLRLAGLRLKSLESVRLEPEADEIGYALAYDNETQIAWLERGLVAAAAMSESDFKDFASTSLKPLRILELTPYVPYHVVVIRPDFDAVLAERLATVLKTIHETEDGANMLKEFEKTTKFDDIPEDLLKNVTALFPYLDLLVTK